MGWRNFLRKKWKIDTKHSYKIYDIYDNNSSHFNQIVVKLTHNSITKCISSKVSLLAPIEGAKKQYKKGSCCVIVWNVWRTLNHWSHQPRIIEICTPTVKLFVKGYIYVTKYFIGLRRCYIMGYLLCDKTET